MKNKKVLVLVFVSVIMVSAVVLISYFVIIVSLVSVEEVVYRIEWIIVINGCL